MKHIFLSLTSFILIWHLAVYFNLIDPMFYPTPFKIGANLIHLLSLERNFQLDIVHSLIRLFLATLISFPAAIILALIVSTTHWLDKLINPMIALLFPLPKVAIYPLLLLIFGIDNESKIALISIGIFYPVFINGRIGFKKIIGGATADILKIYPMSKYEYYWHYLLKGAQIEILTGIKLATNYGLTLVVVSESTASNNGLGYFIWRSWDQFKIINVYSSILLLSILGAIFYYSLDFVIEKNRKKFF